jgi:hypothetical protein
MVGTIAVVDDDDDEDVREILGCRRLLSIRCARILG